MSDDTRRHADARLAAALEESALEDSRPAYRQRLRELRENNPAAFEQAREHYEQAVVPALAADGDPISEWIEYGRWLADLTTPGRLVTIDGSGRAAPYETGSPNGALVLHLPDDGRSAVLPAAVPLSATAAQRATLDLLVYGRVQIGG